MKHINETLQAHLIISPFFCSQKQHILPFFGGGFSLEILLERAEEAWKFYFYVRPQPPSPHNNALFFFVVIYSLHPESETNLFYLFVLHTGWKLCTLEFMEKKRKRLKTLSVIVFCKLRNSKLFVLQCVKILQSLL